MKVKSCSIIYGKLFNLDFSQNLNLIYFATSGQNLKMKTVLETWEYICICFWKNTEVLFNIAHYVDFMHVQFYVKWADFMTFSTTTKI